MQNSPIAVDIETYGDHKSHALISRKGGIRLITAATRGQQPLSFDIRRVGGGWAKTLLENRTVIGHNLRFECEWLLGHLGVHLEPVFCTWSASKSCRMAIQV
jgi:ribonuclease D